MTIKKEQTHYISDKTGKKYFPTIGLEIHAELKTKTKMFCSCKNDPFYSEVNQNICPVCTAHPGTLPYVNKQAVKDVLKVGLAINGKLADFSEFDRKNYFYPDIPKAYQISQYKYPLISGGQILDVDITRIHLEEDTATSSHKDDFSLVDFNRAGVPLMELVTEPVVTSSEQASAFAKRLQLVLRTLDVSDANLEKGQMRIEANVSVSEHGHFDGDFSKLGVKTEVKNLNSFKIVALAIEHEIQRQIEEIENGNEVVQETRGWDENKQATFSQRKKENSDDYRYFPDPDIPKYKISEIEEFSEENLRKELPELPDQTIARYKEFELKDDDIEFYLNNFDFRNLFDLCLEKISDKKSIQLLSNYLSSDVAGYQKDESIEGELQNIKSQNLIDLVEMINDGDLSSRGAKDTLILIYKNGGETKKTAEENGFIQKSDMGELEQIAKKIVEQNPKQKEDFQNGEEKLIQYFIGQGMKETKGSANPQVLKEVFEKVLKS
ncbi:Asp-tRNA(Asn)/Glu-tRNA(Gln) amidotransferase GatCAB subunit B [Candidatus Campbellbacteria bacterium]|nr:MAG: Asp-tRNA(Asn)/Glu-tRNA(Gln) amidotransferase GatCAB subunit B [Candidatus Campbellbacteria bacterium]